jgi:FMN-dependent NADH-azoreductase
MSTLLYIKASPQNTKTSSSLKMGRLFLEEYKKKNPNDKIVELDLYENRPEFLYEGVKVDERNVDFSKLKERSKFVDDFIKADKYLISSPIWNFTIPAILKAYIDQICIYEKTFVYTPGVGPVPLLKNRKVVALMSMGGKWVGTEGDFGGPYLKYIFNNFLGIEYQDLVFEGTSSKNEEQKEETFKDLHVKMIEIISKW